MHVLNKITFAVPLPFETIGRRCHSAIGCANYNAEVSHAVYFLDLGFAKSILVRECVRQWADSGSLMGR